MAMGTKEARQKQEELFYASEQAEAPGHPFYQQLNRVLEQAQFDGFCEQRCRKFYHSRLGRPSLAPGVYFRLLLIGFFEGLGSERGIAWRVADSLSLRGFLNYGLNQATPDHVTISRTRRFCIESAQVADAWRCHMYMSSIRFYENARVPPTAPSKSEMTACRYRSPNERSCWPWSSLSHQALGHLPVRRGAGIGARE